MHLRLVLAVAVLLAGCAATGEPKPTTTAAPLGPQGARLVDSDGLEIPPAPAVTEGPLAQQTIDIIDTVWAGLAVNIEADDVRALGASGDVRVSWLLADLLRFFQNVQVGDAATAAFAELTGAAIPQSNQAREWRIVTDYLIAWDVPAPPGYVDYKKTLFTLVEPGWLPFFDDPDAEVDWRLVSWGGVLIDNRPLGDLEPCLRGCIPALDDPPVTPAAQGSWYADEEIVFGVTVNGESRAYPKHIMEVHEMVNDTLGGRRIGMPYCTLCGAAQAFFTDAVPEGREPLVLRTSGLLSRSNKVMYDLGTQSMFDTFLGKAITGPLREIGFELEQTAVVTSTWGEWKDAHPDTTIVAEDGGRGIAYPADPLRGRDDNGPIFPVGDVDPRLPVQELVLGVVAPDGTPVAFPVIAALATLEAGESVTARGVVVRNEAGGLAAASSDGADLATHQAFWFAWSQFRPTTIVWDG